MPSQPNDNRRAYLAAAEALEAEGRLEEAAHLKALAISSLKREGPDPEVQRLNAEIRAAESVGNWPKASFWKGELSRYITKRDTPQRSAASSAKREELKRQIAEAEGAKDFRQAGRLKAQLLRLT